MCCLLVGVVCVLFDVRSLLCVVVLRIAGFVLFVVVRRVLILFVGRWVLFVVC